MRGFRKQQGTASIIEYALILGVVVMVGIGMAKYLQRSYQAKMHDVQHYALEKLRNECGPSKSNCAGTGNIAEQYEPYYSQSNTQVGVDRTSHKGLRAAAGVAGTFFSRDKSKIQANAETEQLPPMQATNQILLGAH